MSDLITGTHINMVLKDNWKVQNLNYMALRGNWKVRNQT